MLLTEIREGYPHRLLAIGHLFEAEDESWAWLELHNAIRASSKAYQQAGTVAEFATIVGGISILNTSVSPTESPR